MGIVIKLYYRDEDDEAQVWSVGWGLNWSHSTCPFFWTDVDEDDLAGVWCGGVQASWRWVGMRGNSWDDLSLQYPARPAHPYTFIQTHLHTH